MQTYDDFKIKLFYSKRKNQEIQASNSEAPKEDLYITKFLDNFIKEEKPFYLIVEEFNQSVNEGILGRVVGGLTGLALGKAIGGFLVRVFQLQPGTILHKILTSSFFYMAVGAAIGKSSPKKLSTN